MNDDGWEEVDMDLRAIDGVLASAAVDYPDEYPHTVALLAMHEIRSNILIRAERLCETQADLQRYQAAVRASIEQETVLRVKLATLEQVLTERQSAVLH